MEYHAHPHYNDWREDGSAEVFLIAISLSILAGGVIALADLKTTMLLFRSLKQSTSLLKGILNLGRNAVGFELLEKYAGLSVDRVNMKTTSKDYQVIVENRLPAVDDETVL